MAFARRELARPASSIVPSRTAREAPHAFQTFDRPHQQVKSGDGVRTTVYIFLSY